MLHSLLILEWIVCFLTKEQLGTLNRSMLYNIEWFLSMEWIMFLLTDLQIMIIHVSIVHLLLLAHHGAEHIGIIVTKAIITHCPPCSIVEHLQSPFIWAGTISQSHWNCVQSIHLVKEQWNIWSFLSQFRKLTTATILLVYLILIQIWGCCTFNWNVNALNI